MTKNNQLAINTIRSIGIDMINTANSGHPGMVLGSAPMLYTLFTRHLCVDGQHNLWNNRDRFVLASGHASALLYTLLHLSGFDLSMDDLKAFRKLNSKTPGHPELHTPGVDAASGPLGQGIAMAVGMAMAETVLAASYNRENFDIFNHYTYVLCGDGDMQEGVSFEASCIAGHLKLGKLIVLYDSNDVTLDGASNLSMSDNVALRYESMGWHVQTVENGEDIEAIDNAINNAKDESKKPSLIIINTIIGYGSKNQGTSKVHGAPLGIDDGKMAKASYGHDYPDFFISKQVYQIFEESIVKRGKKGYSEWNNMLDAYKEKYPQLYQTMSDAYKNPSQVKYDDLPQYSAKDRVATRDASNQIINYLATKIPSLVSGSADLFSTVKNEIKDGGIYSANNPLGKNMYYGIREFGMATIVNGMLLHGGITPIVGGFMVFSDYLKPAIRMASLMNLPAIYLFSHDSIAVGEDGPTHQPIEHLAMLRSIPNHIMFRPADANETKAAYLMALNTENKPVSIALSRQELPIVTTNLQDSLYDLIKDGAYTIAKEKNKLDAVIIATGSEVHLAIEVKKLLEESGIDIRVVSMPSQELYRELDENKKESIIPSSCKVRVALEMASTYGWNEFATHVYGIDQFGVSANVSIVLDYFGFNKETVADYIIKIIKK